MTNQSEFPKFLGDAKIKVLYDPTQRVPLLHMTEDKKTKRYLPTVTYPLDYRHTATPESSAAILERGERIEQAELREKAEAQLRAGIDYTVSDRDKLVNTIHTKIGFDPDIFNSAAEVKRLMVTEEENLKESLGMSRVAELKSMRPKVRLLYENLRTQREATMYDRVENRRMQLKGFKDTMLSKFDARMARYTKPTADVVTFWRQLGTGEGATREEFTARPGTPQYAAYMKAVEAGQLRVGKPEGTPVTTKTLLDEGQEIISKGLKMDVATLDQYSEDQRKNWTTKIGSFLRMFENRPDYQTEIGVKKLGYWALMYDEIRYNERTGHWFGKMRDEEEEPQFDKKTGKWVGKIKQDRKLRIEPVILQ